MRAITGEVSIEYIPTGLILENKNATNNLKYLIIFLFSKLFMV
jgi:hypothetical protein